MRDEILNEALDKQMEHGWVLNGIFADATSEPDFLPWMYTSGLTVYDKPELMVFAPRYKQFGAVLNDFIETRYLEMEVPDDEPLIRVDGYLMLDAPMWLRTIRTDHPDYPMNVARSLYGADRVRARQIVMPDTGGRAPWDEGYNHQGMRWQKLL